MNEETTPVFGRPAAPVITEDTLLDLCDRSDAHNPLNVDRLELVRGYRVDDRRAEGFETYLLALRGLFDAHPVQVTHIPGTDPAWITFGPVDPRTQTMPEEHDGVRHEDMRAAVTWAVSALTSADYLWTSAVTQIRAWFPDATHVTLSGEIRDSLWLIKVHDAAGDVLWTCWDENAPFTRGAERAVDQWLTEAYWAGLDPVDAGWQPIQDADDPLPHWWVALDAPTPPRRPRPRKSRTPPARTARPPAARTGSRTPRSSSATASPTPATPPSTRGSFLTVRWCSPRARSGR